MNLTLTIMTLQSTPNPTLSRVRAKSQSECDFLVCECFVSVVVY